MGKYAKPTLDLLNDAIRVIIVTEDKGLRAKLTLTDRDAIRQVARAVQGVIQKRGEK